MRLTRQGSRWWTAWVPLLLVGGALALEPQIPLPPGEHQIVRLVMALLMFGIIVYWLRRNRGALINEAYLKLAGAGNALYFCPHVDGQPLRRAGGCIEGEGQEGVGGDARPQRVTDQSCQFQD